MAQVFTGKILYLSRNQQCEKYRSKLKALDSNQGNSPTGIIDSVSTKWLLKERMLHSLHTGPPMPLPDVLTSTQEQNKC